MPVKAIQQFQLGTVLGSEAQARNTLRLIKEAGYDGIELCGFMIKPTPFIVKLLTKMAGMPVGKGGKLNWQNLVTEAGLKVVGIHENLVSIEQDPDAILREAESFNTKYIVITGMYRFGYGSESAVRNLAVRLNKAGEQLIKSGVQLLYHNHNCEFLKNASGTTAYTLLQQETDPAYVNFEFDSYWAAEAGVNALDMMRQLGSRMKLYHINDRGTRIKGTVMTPILKSDSMELGTGNMNLVSLVEQAKNADVDAVILESHRNWVDKSPIRSFQVSAEFLNKHVREELML